MTTRLLALLIAGAACALAHPAAAVSVVTDPAATPREKYAASRLEEALEKSRAALPSGFRILAGVRSSALFAHAESLPDFPAGTSEAFVWKRQNNDWLIAGSDASGVLYGCLEFGRQVLAGHKLPQSQDFTDHPAFKIRGTNLFWMKQGDYDWAVTPENFPWFFDRALMLRYLDELVENGYNTIYFWNGHPFIYFLKLAQYPEAKVLNDADLQRNMDQLQWFTREADRRGIWTVMHFYNIHVSPAFAKAHEREGVRVQNSASTPLLEAYMRRCISEFVSTYPSVGLMLTAGEALSVKQEEWVRDAIIAGIRDSGRQPPLIVRQWTIDPYRFRDIVRPNYENLYTMMKHNTEMIVSPYPDPRNATWISFGQNHIVNVHENGDIKPFRWGSPVFIQQMVKIWKSMGVAGMHLYPEVSWDWPAALDRADPPLLTVDRDRIWLEAFGRYTWQPDRPAEQEERYWKAQLAARFHGAAEGAAVYNYYVKTGPIMPALQNVVNVFNMNYHPLAVSQEASLNGILHSSRWEDVGDYLARPLDDLTLRLFEARYGKLGAGRNQPPLSVREWVAAQSSGGAPDRVDPIRLSALLQSMAEDAVRDLQSVHTADPEYRRFLTDAQCILDLSRFYRAKLEAAYEKGLYDATGSEDHYDRMLKAAAESVSHYSALNQKASQAYLHATDLGYYYRWDRVNKGFQDELAFYQEQRETAKRGADVVYLGLDGPMSDATHTFHWLLEKSREKAGWSAQSYHLEPQLLARAKLAIAYDTLSPAYLKYEPQVEEWVRKGGKLVIWDPAARSYPSHLLDGVSFTQMSSLRGSGRIQCTGAQHPLLNTLSGASFATNPGDIITSSIRGTSSDWMELAYTVLHSTASSQFYTGDETFGPRWTSLMDPAHVTVLLVRKLGAGEVVLAQMGQWQTRSGPDMEKTRLQAETSPLAKLVDNLVRWASSGAPLSAAK